MMQEESVLKKVISILMSILFLVSSVFFVGCGKQDDGKPGEDPDNGSQGESDMTIDKGDSENPTYTFVTDGELAVSTVSRQDTINKLQATDDYGRSFGFMDGYKTDKERYVGLFYFTWLGWHGTQMQGVYDITKLIDENPDALWDTEGNAESPLGQYHYWGEPLYGYYNSKDPWVIRRQMELFTLSGIDFIAFDCTNGYDYIDVVSVILPIMQEMYDEGWDVPKFMFYLNTSSKKVLNDLYYGRVTSSDNVLEKEGIYKNGYYKNLWFAPEGKPKIAAITDPDSTNGEIGDPKDHIVTDPVLLNFFDFWESLWPNKEQYENGLPWMDWTKPQTIYTDTVNVSVAQHNKLPFSDALLSAELADEMWGRGYTLANGPDHSDDAIDAGLNFEEMWQNAIRYDVKYTFVTGWNEWVAIKNAAALGNNQQYEECRGKRVYFVDTVNREYSRDIEMMKGGYGDTTFLQLMRNTRTLKGASGQMAASAKTTVDIKQGMTQWSQVADVYYDVTGEGNRDYRGFTQDLQYKDDSLKNDIAEIRVAHDDENIYVLVVCEDDIVPNVESNNWMNLLIDVEGQDNDAFCGYDYIVNRQSSYTGDCSVEQYAKDGGKIAYKGKGVAKFTLGGKYMQFSIPKSALGITEDGFTINFKVADNVTEPENIQSYYISGDVAPVGRLNYIFKG